MEILNEGSLRKVAEVCDSEKVRTLDLFTRIWGVGAKTAEGFWAAGKRTLDDLRANDMECLNRQQKVGLRLFEDLDERMERAECTEIFEYVKEKALEINKGKQPSKIAQLPHLMDASIHFHTHSFIPWALK